MALPSTLLKCRCSEQILTGSLEKPTTENPSLSPDTFLTEWGTKYTWNLDTDNHWEPTSQSRCRQRKVWGRRSGQPLVYLPVVPLPFFRLQNARALQASISWTKGMHSCLWSTCRKETVCSCAKCTERAIWTYTTVVLDWFNWIYTT